VTVRIEAEHAGRWNRRFVVALHDGARVEAVLYRGDTLCVSSQVGCAVGCPFCASGANGLGRSLSEDELAGQLDSVRRRGFAPKRATVSGVGEPLHALPAVTAFVRSCRRRGIGTSLTTSGGPLKRLRDALHLEHNGLTLSVHAGTEATRARLVPRGPALGPLFELLSDEVPRLTNNRRRKTALAYLVLAGENDGDAEVDAFVDRASPLGLPIHLYAYNPVPTSSMRAVDRSRYEALYDRMRSAGLVVRMSSRARTEDNGGCGTLVAVRPTRERIAWGAAEAVRS